MLVVARTDAGLVRDTNQDRYLVWNLGVDGSSRAGQYVFCAVADGMGGSAAGDRASAMALAVLGEQLLPRLAARCGEAEPGPCDIPRLLALGIGEANAEIRRAASEDPRLEGMGTTLTAGLLARGVLYLAQVGDSRCYRLRSGMLEQQTADHSLVGEMVRQGKLTSEEARTHPRRNIITRALGVQDELEVDFTCQVVHDQDLYLFCSDGLWDLVPDTRIQQILTDTIPGGGDRASAQDLACARLMNAALEQGGDDNITVLMAAVEAGDVCSDAIRDAQSFARTRVEVPDGPTADLKRTLRHRLDEWQQDTD